MPATAAMPPVAATAAIPTTPTCDRRAFAPLVRPADPARPIGGAARPGNDRVVDAIDGGDVDDDDLDDRYSGMGWLAAAVVIVALLVGGALLLRGQSADVDASDVSPTVAPITAAPTPEPAPTVTEPAVAVNPPVVTEPAAAPVTDAPQPSIAETTSRCP